MDCEHDIEYQYDLGRYDVQSRDVSGALALHVGLAGRHDWLWCDKVSMWLVNVGKVGTRTKFKVPYVFFQTHQNK